MKKVVVEVETKKVTGVGGFSFGRLHSKSDLWGVGTVEEREDELGVMDKVLTNG